MSLASPRRVVVLGSYAPSLVNFRGSLIAELVNRGHEVIAMAPEMSHEVNEKIRSLGAQARQVPMVNSSLNPLTLAGSILRLSRELRDLAPHTFIPYTIKPVTIGGIAAARAGVPNIVPLITGLGYAFSEGAGIKRRLSRMGAVLLYRRSLARSSMVIFQNKDDRQDFLEQRILPASVPSTVVNGSGVNLEAFAPAPYPKNPTFLMVARLIADKGVLEYGKAAAQLKKKYPSARFRLAGWFDPSPDGISKEQLAGMVEGGLEYLGKLSDVRPALADASVFVLPSRYREGTPRSSLEALAMARPVVTCDMPGCRETVIEGQNGYLVPTGDGDRLAKAMERFIVDPALVMTMGPRSRQLAEARFDVHDVNKAIIEAAGL